MDRCRPAPSVSESKDCTTFVTGDLDYICNFLDLRGELLESLGNFN